MRTPHDWEHLTGILIVAILREVIIEGAPTVCQALGWAGLKEHMTIIRHSPCLCKLKIEWGGRGTLFRLAHQQIYAMREPIMSEIKEGFPEEVTQTEIPRKHKSLPSCKGRVFEGTAGAKAL